MATASARSQSVRTKKKRRGYVRLYRALLDSPIFTYKKEGLLKLFLYCILKATHKARTVKTSNGSGEVEVPLEAGQLFFGGPSAGGKMCISVSTLRRRLMKLKALGVVNIRTTSHGSIVTICNWSTYQSDVSQTEQQTEQPNEQPNAKSEQASEQASEHIQELSSKKNGSNKNVLTRNQSGGVAPKAEGLPKSDAAEIAFPPELDAPEPRQTIADWLAYKAERREAYKPIGLKAFITRTQTLTKLHGWPTVAAAMEKAMASGWKGYEQDGTFPVKPAAPVSRYVHPDSDEAKEWSPW